MIDKTAPVSETPRFNDNEIAGFLTFLIEGGAHKKHSNVYLIIKQLQADLLAAREEVEIDNKLLAERDRLLEAIPACKVHGDKCIPHAIEWVKSAEAALKEAGRDEVSHSQTYLAETGMISYLSDPIAIEAMVKELIALRERKGRLFFIGLGGSAANCSHAVNDFRKLCGIEAYTPVDNVAELTAKANDEGWDTIFKSLFATDKDALFVLSVGGGKDNVSRPIYHAIDEALKLKMRILGIVGRDGGHTKLYGDCVIVIPTVEPSRVTPHTESFQSVILHCIVSHPDLQTKATKW